MLSVLTMGVSTFAWFQANADVQVRTATNSTTITVSKPDSFSFYAYKGNHNSSHVAGSGEDFDDDFGNVHCENDDCEELGVKVNWNDMDDEDDESMNEEHHDTGHIKAKKPVELRARDNK